MVHRYALLAYASNRELLAGVLFSMPVPATSQLGLIHALEGIALMNADGRPPVAMLLQAASHSSFISALSMKWLCLP
jgi:hypothetical protein